MLESSQKLRELDLFERKLRLSPNGFLYDPLKFSLPDGDIAVIDDLFSFREYNNLMRHFPGAGAIGNPQAGVVQFYTGTKLWKGHDGVGWKEIFSENTPATGTGSVVRANAPTGVGDWIIPTINLTGGQIAFPAIAVPSGDPNTLDDYEEGTFGGSGANGILVAATGSITCGTSFLCAYVKVGSSVSAGGFMQVSGVSGQSGNTHIILPITVKAGIQHRRAGSITVSNIDYTADYLSLRAAEGTTQLQIKEVIDNGAESTLNATGISVDDVVYFSANYQSA